VGRSPDRPTTGSCPRRWGGRETTPQLSNAGVGGLGSAVLGRVGIGCGLVSRPAHNQGASGSLSTGSFNAEPAGEGLLLFRHNVAALCQPRPTAWVIGSHKHRQSPNRGGPILMRHGMAFTPYSRRAFRAAPLGLGPDSTWFINPGRRCACPDIGTPRWDSDLMTRGIRTRLCPGMT
jgi:hypothetical protein